MDNLIRNIITSGRMGLRERLMGDGPSKKSSSTNNDSFDGRGCGGGRMIEIKVSDATVSADDDNERGTQNLVRRLASGRYIDSLRNFLGL